MRGGPWPCEQRRGVVQPVVSEYSPEFDRAGVSRSGLCEHGCQPTRLFAMVNHQGGLCTAEHPEGLTKPWELGGLHRSMEALVIQDKWASLFAEQEIEVARKRLAELGFDPNP